MTPVSKTQRHLKRHYVGSDRPSLTWEQLLDLFHAAEAIGTRELAICVVGFVHGLRASEIANLKVSAINFENKQIRIERGKGSRAGLQPLDAVNGFSEVKVLKDFLADRATLSGAAKSDYLFLSAKLESGERRPLSRVQIFRLFQQVCEAAGLSKELSHPHVLRHSAGQLAYDGGASLEQVQLLLGHRAITSVCVYASPSRDSVFAKISSIFKQHNADIDRQERGKLFRKG
jgi:type 1 fimbriae regulatory protein FimB